jgi:hypothetical protein
MAPRAVPGEVSERVRPVSLAGEQRLPVLPALEHVLPGGVPRGSTVAVAGGSGARSLALAVCAGASAAGSWVGSLGLPSLGLVAAADAGVALERLLLVADPPPSSWATVAATLLDAVDVVLACPPAHVRAPDARRLVARARERGAVLVLAGGGRWPQPVDAGLTVVSARWQGLGDGHGHLQARRVEVVAGGRGAAARERRAVLWLPGPAGTVEAAEPAPVEVEAAPVVPLRDVG